MGRIDAVIDDNIIRDFKIEVVKRKGGKKGDFSIALKEAMDMWIKSAVIKQLKDSISNSIGSGRDYDDMVDALKSQGQMALSVLLEIKDNQINQDKIKYLSKTIKELSEKS